MSEKKKSENSPKKSSVDAATEFIKERAKPKKNAASDIDFSFGCQLIDILVGGGISMGIPVGKILNIVGDKSSGKTFLSNELIAAAYHRFGKKFKWVYDDAESGYSFDTEYLYGFEIMPMDDDDRIKSRNVQQFYVNVRKFAESLKKDEFGVYVIDSLDGLTSKEATARADKLYAVELGKAKEGKTGSYQMESAKFLSQTFFKEITSSLEDKNILLIIISQTRDKIDSMFKEQTRAGGKALDFYAHTVLWLSNLAKIKEKGIPIGVVAKAQNKKSKTPRPYRECKFTVLFDHGVDDIGTSVDYLFGCLGLDNQHKKGDLVWEEGEKESVANIKAFFEEQGWEEDFSNSDYGNKKDDRIDYALDDPDRKKAYESHFGIPYSRDELIQMIEEDETGKMKKELNRRVLEKWEEIEEQARPKRKKKYQ